MGNNLSYNGNGGGDNQYMTIHTEKEEMMGEGGTYEGMTGYMDESGESFIRQTVSILKSSLSYPFLSILG